MKRALSRLIFLFVGIVIGVGAYYCVDNFLIDAEKPPDADSFSTASVYETEDVNKELLIKSRQITGYMKTGDYKALAGAVHPEYGVVFSPYATINLSSNQYFMPSEVAAFATDSTVYVWGIYDGTGAPIEMTPVRYFENFVFNLDYTVAPAIGINYIIKSGNALENVMEIFPTARYIDLHFPETQLTDSSQYWSTLRLVFEYYNEELMLTAIIHSEPTI